MQAYQRQVKKKKVFVLFGLSGGRNVCKVGPIFFDQKKAGRFMLSLR